MPSLHTDFTDAELEILEKVRVQWGLRDLDETAEFLAKRFLRLGMQRMIGNGRSMHLVSLEDFERTSE